MASESSSLESDAGVSGGWQPPLFSSSTWFLILSAGLLFMVYDYWCHQYLARFGVQTPKPLPILGNMPELTKLGFVRVSEEYRKNFGKIFGIYVGRRPMIIISDADMVKQMCVKDFASFTNRKPRGLENRPFHKALFALRDGHWKAVRSVISPTFSASKMKMMAPVINKCLDPTMRRVTKLLQKGKHIQCKDLYGSFVLDSIANCAFGLDISSQEDTSNPFLENCKKIFTSSMLNLPVIILRFKFILNMLNISTFDRKAIDFFDRIIEESVHLRQQSTEKKYVDFLQLMLNVHEEATADNEATVEEKEEMKHRQKMSDKTLTMEEIKSQAFFFFFGGYETVSTTLSMVSYLLATNPEIQDRVVSEIDEIAPCRNDITYENISKMSYLDMVVCEGMRVYPPNLLFVRQGERDYTYKGMTIPGGTEVGFNIWAIHHDPELWPDPEKFNPDRFTKEEREKRHSCAWLPFGFGPRNCVAMRFALLQVKMGLVRMLQNFCLKTCAETEIPPKLGKMNFITPRKGVVLSVVPR